MLHIVVDETLKTYFFIWCMNIFTIGEGKNNFRPTTMITENLNVKTKKPYSFYIYFFVRPHGGTGEGL